MSSILDKYKVFYNDKAIGYYYIYSNHKATYYTEWGCPWDMEDTLKEMGRTQEDSVFVFDEPTIGLHPLDVQVLLGVFDRLVEAGATVLVIEHDLDVIANADYVIDMGPGGGELGGRIVACGTPEQIRQSKESVTGRYL